MPLLLLLLLPVVEAEGVDRMVRTSDSMRGSPTRHTVSIADTYHEYIDGEYVGQMWKGKWEGIVPHEKATLESD